MNIKGRERYLSTGRRRIMTPEEIEAIRNVWAKNLSALEHHTGICRSEFYRMPPRTRARVLQDEQLKTQADLCRMFGISPPEMSTLLTGKTHNSGRRPRSGVGAGVKG